MLVEKCISGTETITCLCQALSLIFHMMTPADGHDRLTLYLSKNHDQRWKGRKLAYQPEKVKIDEREGSFNLTWCIKCSKMGSK